MFTADFIPVVAFFLAFALVIILYKENLKEIEKKERKRLFMI